MTQGTVLIVEDQPELAEVLEYQLRAQGFATRHAPDGLSACRMVGQERPDLILLDILLPDLDGWEVCRLIRGQRDSDIGSVPIIMLTALGAMPDRLKGLEIGADAFIAKPYVVREVILTARRLIARRRREQSLTGEVLRLREQSRQETAIQDILAHELRNQLLILRGFSNLLGRRQTGEEAPDRTCLEAINRSSQNLGNLAESLLLLRRCEDEGLQLPVDHPDVPALLQEVVGLYRPLTDQQRFTLTLECPPSLDRPPLNSLGLRLIVSNLLENALKYCPPGSSVTLRAAVGPSGGLEIVVEDDGPGVPETDREEIFQRFVRGPDRAGSVTGSGLGLYIARSLARAMAGDLEYRPVEPRGSCFRVSFSAPPAPAKES